LGSEKGAHRKTALWDNEKSEKGQFTPNLGKRQKQLRSSNEMKISKTKLIKIVNFEEQ
jgi:hypothetical protein